MKRSEMLLIIGDELYFNSNLDHIDKSSFDDAAELVLGRLERSGMVYIKGIHSGGINIIEPQGWEPEDE